MGEIVILVLNKSESRSIRASSFETGSCFVTDIMIGSMAVMKNTWKWAEMACNGVLLSCSRTREVVPTFEQSSCFWNNNKIHGKCHFYTCFKFQGHGEVVWGNPLFTLKCILWRHVVLDENHGLDFISLSGTILRVKSLLEMILDRRSGVLTIYDVSGPITLAPPPDLASSC